MKLLSQSRRRKANNNTNSNSSAVPSSGSGVPPVSPSSHNSTASTIQPSSALISNPIPSTRNGSTTPTPEKQSNHSILSNSFKNHSRSSSTLSHGSFPQPPPAINTTPSPSNKASPNNSSLSIQALSSISPLLFSKSVSPNPLNGSPATAATFPLSNDNQRLELAKALEQSLLKFNNLKKNNTLKANILRLNLLPYLRFPIKPFININELLSTSIIDLNIEILLYETKILINWWSELLNILLIDFSSVSALDRNCFFETVSRLLSHNIWLLFQTNITYSQQFNDIHENYKRLLLQTFEFAILRLNSKTVSLSVSIFIGKIFSYAFFHLNDISRGLSFLLNTKLINYKRVYNLCIFDSFNNLNSNFVNQFPNILNDLSSQFPNHLAPLISSNIQPRETQYIIESQFMNSIFPPREKIEGIRETKGVWVNRWSSIENISLFCSFFRNYLTLSSIYLRNFPLLMIDQYYIFGMPGFLAFLTHIYQIFNLQLKNQAVKNSTSSKFKNNPNNMNNIPSYNENLLMMPPKISSESNIDKCFNVLRDLLVNPRNSNERLLKPGVIKGYENILKLFIKKTNILDTFMVETLLNLFIQFLKTIDVVNENNLNEMNQSLIDWKFWLDILIRLLDSNNLNCEVKAISTFYQIWDYIPNDVYLSTNDHNNNSTSIPEWISNPQEHLKMNLTEYLLSSKNWFKFFGHYMPFERNLYIKLIIWKILGLSSFENLITYQDLKLKNSSMGYKIKSIVDLRLDETYSNTKDCLFQPSDLLMKKKFTIIRTVGSDIKKRDKKLRSYPYEVLDDAVYTSYKQPTSSSKSNSASNGSLSTLPRSTSANSLDSNDSTPKASKTSHWMGKIFNKSHSQSSLETPNTNKLGKLLAMSKSSSEKREMASPISSLSSSLSSLELNNQSFDGVGNLIHNNSVNSLDNDNRHSSPPEWDLDIDIEKDNYEFILVDDEIKIQSFMQKLNDLNQTRKFNSRGEVLIINDKPRLPNIKVNKTSGGLPNGNSHSRLNMDSLESIVDEDETKIGEEETFLGNDIIDNDVIDLNGGFDQINGLDLNTEQNFGYITGTKIFNEGSNPEIKSKLLKNSAISNYLSNGLLEYNEEIIIFENFMNERIRDLVYNELVYLDDLQPPHHENWNLDDGSSSSFLEIPMNETIRESYDQSYRLSNKGYSKMKKDIPNIVPDIPGDRLNAY